MKPYRLASTAFLLALAGCPFEREKEADEPAPAGAPVTAGLGDWPLVYVSTGHPVTALTVSAATVGLESEVEGLANGYRVAAGLGSLQTDGALSALARAHSEHMILHGFFGHRNPEGDWPTERASSAGIPFASIGENIAAGQPTAQEVFAAWLASPSHKELLDRADWTHHAVGYAYTDVGGLNHFWSHEFRHE